MSPSSHLLCFPSSGIRRVPRTASSSSQQSLAGVLQQRDASGRTVSSTQDNSHLLLHGTYTSITGRKVFANKEFIIGRDRSKCQFVINDPSISKKHLRVYSVVYDDNDPTEVDILVYAEDLSSNGTYWNGSLIGRGNGGFLLSPDDKLKLAPNVFLDFQVSEQSSGVEHFDAVQEVEMAKFRHSYVLTDRLLGCGAFGRVFMAVEQCTRRQLACKVVDLRKLRSSIPIGRREEPTAAENVDGRVQMRKLKDWVDKQKKGNKLQDKLRVYSREVEILTTISHPNIIGLEKVYVTDNTIYMFQDLITGGDLFSYLESKNGKLLEVEAAVIVRQLLVAVKYLHDNNIVHRDLKPDNILMTSSSSGCRVVITDFGAARRIDHGLHRMTSLVGTEEYTAPEVLCDGPSSRELTRTGYTKSVDLWALGCVTVILLTGGSAFVDPESGIYSEKLAHSCNLDFLQRSRDWQHVRSRPKTFVENLLLLDENKRLTAQQALAHEWFSNEVHRTDFRELYQRTIKHWRPRPSRSDVVEFRDAAEVKYLVSSGPFGFDRPRTFHGETAIDAHYQPAPKKVHSILWPRQRSDSTLASEVVRKAIRSRWPVKGRYPDVFDDDNDGEEAEKPLLKLRRQGTLRSTQADSSSSSPRARRSNSVSVDFMSSRTHDILHAKSAVDTRSSDSLPKPHSKSNHLLVVRLSSNTSVNEEGDVIEALSTALTTRNKSPGASVPLNVRASKDMASTNHLPKPQNVSHIVGHQSAAKLVFQKVISGSTTSNTLVSDCRDKSMLIKTKSFINKETAIADSSTPTPTGILKRWQSPLVQDATGSRSSSKRRRSSIFEIQEDEDAERTPYHEQSTKRTKNVDFVNEQDVFTESRSENDTDGVSDNEITLPHHPQRARLAESFGAEAKLYLPR